MVIPSPCNNSIVVLMKYFNNMKDIAYIRILPLASVLKGDAKLSKDMADGYYVAYKPTTLLCISFMLIDIHLLCDVSNSVHEHMQ